MLEYVLVRSAAKSLIMAEQIMKFLFLSCEQATLLTEKKRQGELPPLGRLRLSIHQSMCKACTLYEKQSELLDRILKKGAPDGPDEASVNSLKNRIRKKIGEN